MTRRQPLFLAGNQRRLALEVVATGFLVPAILCLALQAWLVSLTGFALAAVALLIRSKVR